MLVTRCIGAKQTQGIATAVKDSKMSSWCAAPFIQGFHGQILQDEGAAYHEDSSSQADAACTAQIEAVSLVRQKAALQEVNDHHR